MGISLPAALLGSFLTILPPAMADAAPDLDDVLPEVDVLPQEPYSLLVPRPRAEVKAYRKGELVIRHVVEDPPMRLLRVSSSRALGSFLMSLGGLADLVMSMEAMHSCSCAR